MLKLRPKSPKPQIPQTSSPASTDGGSDISEIDRSDLVLAVLARLSFERRDLVWVIDSGVFTDEVRTAISAAIAPPVQFVADAREAWGDAGVLPEDEVLLGFTKKPFVVKSVIGMDLWKSTGPTFGSGHTWLFQWDGLASAWLIVEPEQVDVTVTTAVS